MVTRVYFSIEGMNDAIFLSFYESAVQSCSFEAEGAKVQSKNSQKAGLMMNGPILFLIAVQNSLVASCGGGALLAGGMERIFRIGGEYG